MIRVQPWTWGLVLGLLWSSPLSIAGSKPNVGGTHEAPATKKVKVLILIGGHGFDQVAFDKFWRNFRDLACDTWKGSPYTAFDDINQFPFDVILMYNLSSGITERQKQNFLKLLDKGVGLVVWHHALANCQDWSEFEKIVGARFWLQAGERDGVKVPGSGTGWGKVKSHIEDPNHPITRGLADFVVEDEPYNRQTFRKNIRVLVTTDFPASDKILAWVHRYGKARVFGYQSGHDARVWTNESFQRLMGRGIRWAAGRRPESE
jgi:type 1 glutamine amidotransferase